MNDDAEIKTAIYRPEVFEVATMDLAKAVILTPEVGTTTEERWVRETAYLVDDIAKYINVGPETCVLDFGCGIGRLAKGLIDRYQCRVFGVDFSKAMQLLAPEYVLSDRFVVWSPETLTKMVNKGFRTDAAISAWVIQHTFNPEETLKQISEALKPRACLYALNQNRRCVPTNLGWVDDGIDQRALMCRIFEETEFHRLPEEISNLSASSMIQVLRRRDADARSR